MKKTVTTQFLAPCIACFLAFGLAGFASAQTRVLRIVTYNIAADTGGYTTARPGLITPSGGTVQQGGVLEGIGEENVGSDSGQPIDILALEETYNNTTTVAPIVSALNTYYNAPGMYAMSTYQATSSGGTTSGGGPNAVIYNTTTVQLVASVPVDPPGGTSQLGSTSGEYRELMRYEFAPAGVTATPANEFYIYVSHYKASTGTLNASYRLGEAQIIRNNETSLPANARVLYVGDYNPDNGSGEPGYQTIISNTAPNGIVQGGGIDPMNLSGAANLNWSNGSLIGQNTESATSLRYRDDLQVMTTNVYYGAPGGLAYVPGTYHVFGNNGTTAFGGSVGSGNSALTNLVSSASYPYQYISASQLYTDLTTASDHLPVVADYTIQISSLSMAVSPTSAFASAGIQGGSFSPSSQTYTLTNGGTGPLNWTASNLAGWLTLSATAGTLPAGATTNISASINASANSLTPNTYSDTLSFTNTSNGTGNTTRAVSLIVNPPPAQLAVGPLSGLSSSGYLGGPFSPPSQTYSLTNVGGTSLSWSAGVTANWLTLSAASGSLAPGAATNVTVSINGNANGLAADPYSDTVGFTNSSNGAGNAMDTISLTVIPTPGQLAVGPLSGFNSSGLVGGPFSPADQTYSLTNLGGTALDWTANITAPWLTLSATGGTLAPGDSTNITLSINANAEPLTVGAYSDTISFTNASNGLGNSSGPVSLLVLSPSAQLVVGPTSGFDASGYVGGLFFPASQIYSLTNLGATELDWTATITADWLTLSVTSGTLAVGASTNVIVSINANADSLAANTYWDPIGFTNISNGAGDTNWAVSLTINFIPPVALFTGSPTTGTEPLTVAFNDTSTGDITNRFWDFGDGATTNTTATTVTHVYGAGTYAVTLVASGPGGVSTNSQPNYIAALTAFQSWQLYYFGSTINPAAAPGADPDHDGISNTNEFLAGTNPTNRSSGLGITAVTRQGNDLLVSWMVVSGKNNMLDQAGDPRALSNFTNVFSNVVLGSVTTYTNVGAATNGSNRYYRVGFVP